MAFITSWWCLSFSLNVEMCICELEHGEGSRQRRDRKGEKEGKGCGKCLPVYSCAHQCQRLKLDRVKDVFKRWCSPDLTGETWFTPSLEVPFQIQGGKGDVHHREEKDNAPVKTNGLLLLRFLLLFFFFLLLLLLLFQVDIGINSEKCLKDWPMLLNTIFQK